jgi:hypothetical protein
MRATRLSVQHSKHKEVAGRVCAKVIARAKEILETNIDSVFI